MENQVGLGDCRPISLIGCLYKVLAKLLSMRLKKVLTSAIDVPQFAFLGGRNITDGVLIASEAIDRWKKGLLIKLNFCKRD